jgi:diadenosine tetraphosphate (Ap4A) HIT family hydrolase
MVLLFCGLQTQSQTVFAEHTSGHSINIRQNDGSYIITPRKFISLDELMTAKNRTVLDQIILEIAHLAKQEQQFRLMVQNVDGHATWRLEPTSRKKDMHKHPRSCPFCDIIHDHSKGRIVAENSGALAFLDIKKFSYPRCLIIPKKRIISMGSIRQNDLASIHEMAKLITSLIKKYPQYKNFSLEMHTGAKGDQTVFHLHWHFKVPTMRIPAHHAFELLN